MVRRAGGLILLALCAVVLGQCVLNQTKEGQYLMAIPGPPPYEYFCGAGQTFTSPCNGTLANISVWLSPLLNSQAKPTNGVFLMTLRKGGISGQSIETMQALGVPAKIPFQDANTTQYGTILKPVFSFESQHIALVEGEKYTFFMRGFGKHVTQAMMYTWQENGPDPADTCVLESNQCQCYSLETNNNIPHANYVVTIGE